mmetsp:Transcript_3553/g.13799  ORF Transcript_3553/g.13799 Transcript_3553/m.13799 type:complete len:187 (-) Transcript_3553:405-965(-)
MATSRDARRPRRRHLVRAHGHAAAGLGQCGRRPERHRRDRGGAPGGKSSRASSSWERHSQTTEPAQVRPGSLKDRIITDHISLLTTSLREVQVAKFKAMRNVACVTVVLAVIGYFFIKIANKRGEARLREQEVEIFGTYRTASAIQTPEAKAAEQAAADEADEEEDVIKRAQDDAGKDPPPPRKPT